MPACLSLAFVNSTRGGDIDGTPVLVDCGTKIRVTEDNDGFTLTLDSSDPIFSKTCKSVGIHIGNPDPEQSATLDCANAGTIRGGEGGTGVRLQGRGLAVMNCVISGFKTGIRTTNDGAEVIDNIVSNASGDGFVVRNPTSLAAIANGDTNGMNFIGNQSFNNGGWGFRMSGSEITADEGDVFLSNLASGNGRGGFSVRGKGHTFGVNDAISNGGPGFLIVGTNCCLPNSFDGLGRALGNRGPGVAWIGPDDGACQAGGGLCLPTGIDVMDTSVLQAFANDPGACPANTVEALGGEACLGVNLRCSEDRLFNCP